MKTLTRDDILTPKLKAVPIDGMGGGVYVRQLTLGAIQAMRDGGNPTATQWIIACACDESGAPLFTADDAAQLESSAGYEFSMAVLKASMEHNGFGDESIEELSGN